MKLLTKLLLVAGVAVSVNAYAGDPAVDAAACGAYLGTIGYIQQNKGDIANGKVNLGRFSRLDDQWGGNATYRQAQKNIDANLAKDPANMSKNIVALSQGCTNLGLPKAQF